MYQQVKLTYGYGDLEPVLDEATVETHYTKHHATYTANLNALAEEAGMANLEITELLKNLCMVQDAKLQTGLRNNGGGFYNHNLYFAELSPNGKRQPEGELAEKIAENFGSFDAFKEKISALAVGQFGSGWAWLSVTPDGNLVLSNSANQDNPISQRTGNIPIFTIDVWEHAYYLKYRNLRADYVKRFFDIVDWNVVEENYQRALKKLDVSGGNTERC